MNAEIQAALTSVLLVRRKYENFQAKASVISSVTLVLADLMVTPPSA